MRRTTPETRSAIDWNKVKERLTRAAAATEEALHPSPELARLLLDERARKLALVPVPPPRPAEILEVVAFRLGEERYAIGTQTCREVGKFGEVTPIPGGPDFLVGVVNLRGEILAVLDLRSFLGLGERQAQGSRPGLLTAAPSGLKTSPEGAAVNRPGREPWSDLSRILVLGNERAEFGLLVDAVQEVLHLRLEDVLEPPASLQGLGRECLRGVTGDALIVLDGAALLQDQRLFIDVDVAEGKRHGN